MEDIFSIKDKVIIITGAGKGIGKFLAMNMAKQSAIVYGIDLKFSKKVPENLSDKYYQINCDITKNLKFQKICKMIFENPLYDLDVNTKSTLAILETLRKSELNCRFILGSTFVVIGKPDSLPINEESQCKPTSIYGANRLTSEKFL